MCGRFTLGKEPNSLLDYFHLHGEVANSEVLNFKLSYNIAPTQMTPVVFSKDKNRVCELMRWGLIPSWSKGADAKFNMINARAENITEKPAYRTAFKQRRCLVPVDGYYEWSGQSKPKQPYFIYEANQSLFALAGIWEQWQAEAGPINSFSIITTSANEVMQTIHHRMPVIIRPDQFDQWLFDDERHSYQDLLTPVADLTLKYHAVNTRVNTVKNNFSELTNPA